MEAEAFKAFILKNELKSNGYLVIVMVLMVIPNPYAVIKAHKTQKEN